MPAVKKIIAVLRKRMNQPEQVTVPVAGCNKVDMMAYSFYYWGGAGRFLGSVPI
jgi:hypothetical protein